MSGPEGAAAVALAREAVVIAADGDRAAAVARLERARSVNRARARRERQLVEIAAAVVDGELTRADGLAAEHRHEFPADAGLLDELLRPRGVCVPRAGTDDPGSAKPSGR